MSSHSKNINLLLKEIIKCVWEDEKKIFDIEYNIGENDYDLSENNFGAKKNKDIVSNIWTKEETF